MIEIRDLSFEYQTGKPVLHDINLSIKKGEWVTILGHNGSGKSTLSKLIVGLLKPKTGSVVVDGLTLSHDTVHAIRRKVGIVFQNPDNQFVGVTVRDDIAFGLENLQVPREDMIERIERFAQKVGMTEFLNKEPHALSGGQKQRVAIAGILAMDTDVIIFDEATSMLDPKGRRMIVDYMRQLNREGVTILTITHDMKEAVLSDRIVILKEGKILLDDQAELVLNNRDMLEQSNLELLLPLRVRHALKERGLKHPELEALLWASSSNK